MSTESPKEGFNDTVFQQFVDELKHYFQHFCVYRQYVFVMLPFRMIFFS